MSIQTKSLGAKASLSVWGCPPLGASESRGPPARAIYATGEWKPRLASFNYILTKQLILKINKDTMCFPRGMHLCRHL